jgi:hypothetical protein
MAAPDALQWGKNLSKVPLRWPNARPSAMAFRILKIDCKSERMLRETWPLHLQLYLLKHRMMSPFLSIFFSI